jgi:hypothetical protein
MSWYVFMHFITILIASSCFSNYSDFFHLEDFDSILPPTVTLRLRAVFAFFFFFFCILFLKKDSSLARDGRGVRKSKIKKRDKNKRKRETVLKMKIISFACRIRQWRQYREVYYGNKYDRHFFGSFFRFVGKLTCSIFFSSNTRWHFG